MSEIEQTTVSTTARPSPNGRKPHAARPRLGFVGLGWIGRDRLSAVAQSGLAEIVALADPSNTARQEAAELAPGADSVAAFDDLLARDDIDGIAIATPSGMHAAQAIRAFEAGKAVFCQKPLGRTAAEVQAVIDAARTAGRLLGADFSYRYVVGVDRMRELIRTGALGQVYAANLVFHNAYGPDKAWFYDPARSGGGCVIDLGVHLVDLALWLLDFPRVVRTTSRLFVDGEVLRGRRDKVEDYATACLDLDTAATVQLACSWRLPAGQDAVIEAAFYGTRGGVALRNVNGSFYDFCVERFTGTQRETLSQPPDAWGGRALVDWTRRLAAGQGFDRAATHAVDVAHVIDRIYERAEQTV